MQTIIDVLLTTQPLLTRKGAAQAEKQAAIEALRLEIPAPVLAHYLRLLACDRRGVALVHHGVCGECHIRVPQATAHSLAHPDDLHLCENCGCYLALAAEERPGMKAPPVAAPPPVVRRVRRRAALACA